jgi:hypothetical protein
LDGLKAGALSDQDDIKESRRFGMPAVALFATGNHAELVEVLAKRLKESGAEVVSEARNARIAAVIGAHPPSVEQLLRETGLPQLSRSLGVRHRKIPGGSLALALVTSWMRPTWIGQPR